LSREENTLIVKEQVYVWKLLSYREAVSFNVCVSRSLKRSEGESAARRVSPLPAEENWTAYTEAVSV
jgi:hypothetical protein